MASLRVLIVALWLIGGCGAGGPQSAGGEDASVDDPTGCVIDSSRDQAGAIALGTDKVAGQICPRGDVDWYALEVPMGADLIDLMAGFPTAPTKVAIVAQLFAADGTTAIAEGQIADTRTGVRKGTIGSTVRVPGPGRYLLAVRDLDGTQSDSLNSYVLQVTTAKDPDTHEPNDTTASATAPDGLPGWLSYRGDHDRYKVTVPPGSSLIAIHLDNPATAQTVLHYALLDAKGQAAGEGDAPPSATPVDSLRVVPGGLAGDYVVDVSGAAESVPDRRPDSGYTIALSAKPELDANDAGGQVPRNDNSVTATCLVGGAPADPMTGCPTPYNGGVASFSAKGQIGSLGDRDYFRFDVLNGLPAVVEVSASMGDTKLQLALDLLVPDPSSECEKDSECVGINKTCKADTDCETSHSCLPAGTYKYCPLGQSCRLCAGASACVPLGDPAAKPVGKKVCAVPQFLVHDTDNTHALRTAQPLFTSGPRYLVVHDFQDDGYDYGKGYSVDVRIVPEPDPGDQSGSPAMRNNFYNPYPMQKDDLRPSQARAIDVSDDLMAGRPIPGFISYASDEDWFSFKHPCPNMDCGLVFEWTQPGPSPMRAAFLMRRDDLGIHESWTYSGQVPTEALPGPVTATFGEGDCHECSFGSAKYTGKSYYLQVRAVGGKSWDSAGTGGYSFRLKAVNPGCPLNCSEFSGPMNMCTCFCKALNMCPPGPAL